MALSDVDNSLRQLRAKQVCHPFCFTFTCSVLPGAVQFFSVNNNDIRVEHQVCPMADPEIFEVSVSVAA